MEGNYEYKPVLFFLMAYVVTWIPWSLAVYAGSQPGLEAYAVLFNLIGLLGPPGAALFLILTSGSKALKSDFHDRIVNLRRIRPVYAILAVVAASRRDLLCRSQCRCGSANRRINSGCPAGPNLIGHDHPRLGDRADLGGDGLARLWRGQSQSQDRNDEGDAAVRRSMVGVACAAGPDRRHLSERAGEDGQSTLYLANFFVEHHPRGHHRQLVLLQEQPLDRSRPFWCTRC